MKKKKKADDCAIKTSNMPAFLSIKRKEQIIEDFFMETDFVRCGYNCLCNLSSSYGES